MKLFFLSFSHDITHHHIILSQPKVLHPQCVSSILNLTALEKTLGTNDVMVKIDL